MAKLHDCETSRLAHFLDNRFAEDGEEKLSKISYELNSSYGGEFHNVYYSSNVIITIKSKRMRRAGNVACTYKRGIQGFDGKARRKEATRKTWK
jgi:hypothetical protein